MPQMITILGPTASGKTPLAAALAYEIGGEIISADSRQVYRRMDIGTGKDLADYTVQGSGFRVPYHLIDICEPGTKYNLFQYQQDFFDAYHDIIGRGVTPILCGGAAPTTGGQVAGGTDADAGRAESQEWFDDAQQDGRGLLSKSYPRHRDRGV